MRLLIQTGRPLGELTETTSPSSTPRSPTGKQSRGRSFKHYRVALHASRTVIYHLGAPVTAAVKRSVHLRWPWERHFDGVPTGIGRSLVRLPGMRRRAPGPGPPCSHMASRLAHFARFITTIDPAADHAGRAGPATPHRALPGRGRRGPHPHTGTRRCPRRNGAAGSSPSAG